MSEQINWSDGFPVVAGHMRLGLTEASPETQGYWDGVARGELMLKRCLGCGRHLHPRRMACPDCYGAGVEWARSSGRATVYSFSSVYRAPSDELRPSVPYCVGIVHLAEGVHLFTRLIPASAGTGVGTDDAPEPEIGAAATLDFRTLENGQRLPVFVYAAAGG